MDSGSKAMMVIGADEVRKLTNEFDALSLILKADIDEYKKILSKIKKQQLRESKERELFLTIINQANKTQSRNEEKTFKANYLEEPATQEREKSFIGFMKYILAYFN